MEMEEKNKIVPCKGAKSRAIHVKFAKCKECQHFGGLEQVKAGYKDIPPVELVTCNKPWTIKVVYMAEEPKV